MPRIGKDPQGSTSGFSQSAGERRGGLPPTKGMKPSPISPQGGPAVETGALQVLRGAGITGAPIPGGWTAEEAVVFSAPDADDSNIWELPVSPLTGRVSGTPRRLTFGSGHEEAPAISAS